MQPADRPACFSAHDGGAVGDRGVPGTAAAAAGGASRRLLRTGRPALPGCRVPVRLAAVRECGGRGGDRAGRFCERLPRAVAVPRAAGARTPAASLALYRIALNIARNRRRRRRPELAPLEAAGARLLGEARAEEQPERRALDAERRRELPGLLAALPAPYRVAVVLRHLEGFGYRELAALLRQPVGTVKSNVHRGTRQLRAALIAQEQEVFIS